MAAIERLDSAHSNFQQEMDIIAKRAELLAKQMEQKVKFAKLIMLSNMFRQNA